MDVGDRIALGGSILECSQLLPAFPNEHLFGFFVGVLPAHDNTEVDSASELFDQSLTSKIVKYNNS